MELWIRSQDKQIMLPNPILIVDDNIILTPKNDYRDTHLLLGHYKTKERALKVLDEIQNILKPKYILDTSSIKPDGDFYEENGVIFQNYDANAKIEELSTFVYQMPEK